MRVYHGIRTGEGCLVTVDGVPLPVRSDLSGATAPFDWGYVGNGQLSLALLSHLLGDGREARALSEAFERGVVARLPHDAWTLTDADLTAALRALAGAPATKSRPAETSGGAGREAFGDMPVDTSHLAPPPGQPGTTPG
jgi:hypothetical protein